MLAAAGDLCVQAFFVAGYHMLPLVTGFVMRSAMDFVIWSAVVIAQLSLLACRLLVSLSDFCRVVARTLRLRSVHIAVLVVLVLMTLTQLPLQTARHADMMHPLTQGLNGAELAELYPQPSPSWNYGGEAEESIRHMQMDCEPCEEPAPAAELSEAEEKWLGEVEKEVRLIEALPFVKGSVRFFESDVSANLNKVEVAVWCCWSGSSFKRPVVQCDETGEKPTHLEAARALRAKLLAEHGQAGHEIHPRAADRRRHLEAAGELEPQTAFERIQMSGMVQRRTRAQVAIDEKAVAEAREVEGRATAKREAAEARLKASREKAAAFKEPSVSHKKQRSAFGAFSSCACGSSSCGSSSVCTTMYTCMCICVCMCMHVPWTLDPGPWTLDPGPLDPDVPHICIHMHVSHAYVHVCICMSSLSTI